MSSAFSIALSSLQAQSEAINTTGNNLANMNTVGFKGSNVDFEDMLSQAMGSAQGSQVGMGVNAPINNQVFTQGAIQSSTSPLATAIQGNGFFVVNNSSGQQLYTRDGDFTLNQNGVLQTQTGETVQGWVASANGTLNTTGAPTNIVVPSGSVLPPVATQNVSMSVNLDADGTVGDPTSGSFSVPMQVVDSLGDQHTLNFDFTKTGTNTWSYQVSMDQGDLAGGTAGTQQNLLTTPGTITFNSDGTMSNTTASPAVIGVTGLADGASNMSINWNLFSNGAGTITQYAQSSSSASSTQDGSQASQLTGVSIGSGGQIVSTFSNGQQKVEGQLALAAIQNPESLQNVGDNNFAASANTAAPSIGLPQTGGRGQIEGGALEGSNVDMATEFTNLITYQSAYQASSRVITTADNMTQDLMNLIH